MYPTRTLRVHGRSLLLGGLLALSSTGAIGDDKPASTVAKVPMTAQPCLVSTDCRQLDTTPFTVCYTTTRCDQGTTAERLSAPRMTYAAYRR
jgi:hypothetical protein